MLLLPIRNAKERAVEIPDRPRHNRKMLLLLAAF